MQEVGLRKLKPLDRISNLARSLTALGLVVALTGPVEARTFDAIMSEAIEAKKAEDYERVVKLLEEAIALQPSPALINNLGSTFEKLGRYGDAVKAYTRVENDTNAPQELRNLDASRRAALAHKLGRIWVVTSFDRPGAQLRVDGEVMELEAGEELGLDRGAHTFECSAPDVTEVLLRFERFPVSRRSKLSCALGTRGATDLWFSVGPDDGVAAITVNGYELQASLESPRVVRFASGTAKLELVLKDGTRRKLTLTPERRGEAQFAQLMGSSERVSAPAPMGVTMPLESAQASSYMPLITAGAGLVGVAVGAGFMALADSQRQDIADAANASGDLPLSADPEMNQVQAYQTQDDARDNDELGTAILAVGASVAIGGAIWWLFSEEEGTTQAAWDMNLGPGGLSLTGRF